MPAWKNTKTALSITEGQKLMRVSMSTLLEPQKDYHSAPSPIFPSPYFLSRSLCCSFSAHIIICTKYERKNMYDSSTLIREPDKIACPGSSLPHWLLQYSSSVNLCFQTRRRGLLRRYHPRSAFYWPRDTLAAAQTPRSL